VPVGVTGASNVVNMLAGFNGLMSGLGIISCLSLTLVSLSLGQYTSAYLLLTMVGAQAAFHLFNRYPAKVFPGDTGTLSLGALITAAIVVGNIEFWGVLFLGVHILNATMSLGSVGRFFEEKTFRKEKFSALHIWEDGRISFDVLEKPITLCKTFLYKRPQMEYELTGRVCTLHALISVIFLLVFYFTTM
ncbi:MAG: hypothetical protein ABH950_04400, partial [Candidatus Altiarchaeota archaeon]